MQSRGEGRMKLRTIVTVIMAVLAIATIQGCATSSKTMNGTSSVSPDTEKALETRLQLALGYMTQGDRERAREHLEKAMQINSRSPEVHDVWALLYQQEMELAEAESHYKKALSYDPGFTRSRNNYGMFLLRQERYEEAYQQFVKGSEDLAYPKRGEIFYKAGVTAIKLNKLTEGEEALQKAVVLAPQMSQPYLELAEIAYTRADYQRAKQMLEKYNDARRRPTPRGLWLGVRLENRLGNRDAEASQGLALKNLFPDSQENQEYLNWLQNDKQD